MSEVRWRHDPYSSPVKTPLAGSEHHDEPPEFILMRSDDASSSLDFGGYVEPDPNSSNEQTEPQPSVDLEPPLNVKDENVPPQSTPPPPYKAPGGRVPVQDAQLVKKSPLKFVLMTCVCPRTPPARGPEPVHQLLEQAGIPFYLPLVSGHQTGDLCFSTLYVTLSDLQNVRNLSNHYQVESEEGVLQLRYNVRNQSRTLTPDKFIIVKPSSKQYWCGVFGAHNAQSMFPYNVQASVNEMCFAHAFLQLYIKYSKCSPDVRAMLSTFMDDTRLPTDVLPCWDWTPSTREKHTDAEKFKKYTKALCDVLPMNVTRELIGAEFTQNLSKFLRN